MPTHAELNEIMTTMFDNLEPKGNSLLKPAIKDANDVNSDIEDDDEDVDSTNDALYRFNRRQLSFKADMDRRFWGEEKPVEILNLQGSFNMVTQINHILTYNAGPTIRHCIDYIKRFKRTNRFRKCGKLQKTWLRISKAKMWYREMLVHKKQVGFFFSFFTIYSLIILFLTTILFLKINNLGLWAISKVMDRAKSKALREYNIPNSIRPTSECYVSYMDEFTKSYMAAISRCNS